MIHSPSRKKKKKKKRPTSAVARKSREEQLQKTIERSTTTATRQRPSSANPTRPVRGKRPALQQRTTNVNQLDSMAHQPTKETRLKRRRRKRPSTAGGSRKVAQQSSSATIENKRKNNNNNDSIGTGRNQRRPQSAAAGLRKSTSSLNTRNNYSNHENEDVRTSFPPVKRGRNGRNGRRGQENKGGARVNGWMQTSVREAVPLYDALNDRYCPLYKPKNLLKGKAGVPSPGSNKHKMKKWREKYNNELRQSISENMREVMNMKDTTLQNSNNTNYDDENENHHYDPEVVARTIRRERPTTNSSSSSAVLKGIHEGPSFPFPDTAEENSIMFQPPSANPNERDRDRSTSNITFGAPPPRPTMDAATRNKIRGRSSGHTASVSKTRSSSLSMSSSSNHSQHEVQVVKAILHRERLVQMLRQAIGVTQDPSFQSSNGNGTQSGTQGGKYSKRERAHNRVYGKHCSFQFLFPFPPSNLFHCVCHVLPYFKTPQQVFFLTQ